LREADRMLGEGSEVPAVAKALEVSEATYHRWRTQYGGMKADDVKRLKELERENQSLKRIVVNSALEIDALKEIARGRMKVKRSPEYLLLVDVVGLPVGDGASVGVLGLLGGAALEFAALLAVDAVAGSAALASWRAGGELDLAELLRGGGRHRVCVVLFVGEEVPEEGAHLAGDGNDRDRVTAAAADAFEERAEWPGAPDCGVRSLDEDLPHER
jgi:transposase-like protein